MSNREVNAMLACSVRKMRENEHEPRGGRGDLYNPPSIAWDDGNPLQTMQVILMCKVRHMIQGFRVAAITSKSPQ